MPNRLADESSPYLRQHADNPVDWYPWGPDAFARAEKESKPILLSVGYSACHWCHVMAHESFEDADVAALMNELFVNVKVDREERPDVDAIYMDAVQAMTGQGGWPMTVFLTPDGRPFFGGTYFPKTSRGGMLGFTDLCRRIADVWTQRRDDIDEQADALTEAIGRSSDLAPGDGVLDRAMLGAAYAQLRQNYDPVWGGFGTAPKFPQTMTLDLLLRAHVHNGSAETLEMVTNSLDAMASGGIYDHLGGGFARYSTDEQWLVPHFEKMLYDQALLVRVYLHAWQITDEPRYRQVLDETVGYVLRDLRHAGGGFYSAEDADSEGVEGKFYVWSLDELRDVAGPDADAAAAWWDVTEGGNFEGANILWRPVRGDLLRPAEVERARLVLFDGRELRVRPGLDDKVLTEWNALFTSSLAEAAFATHDRTWLDAAVGNAEFLLQRLRRDDGRWLRSWQADTGARHLAYAADHAALVDAFVRLAEATGEARWIVEARSVADVMLDLFWDDERGGLFTTGRDAEQLVTRPKDLFDNATPSANSLAANALVRLGALTGELRYHDRADAIIRLLAEPAARHPMAFGHLLAAVDLVTDAVVEVAIAGDRPDLLTAVRERFLPNVVLAWGERYESPIWEGREDGKAYVCRDFACLSPVTDATAMLDQIAAV
jgi:uncharacterized protein YyaL (SSP411 family)